MEGIDLVWVEECQSMSEEAWQVIMPTIIRKPGSKGIISFNTGAETDPTYRRWVVNPPKLSVVHQINYDQNEFFTEELESIRVYDEQNLDKDLYDNIWNGLPLKLSDDVIFRNRVTIKEFEAPINADYLHGIDFGFSSDPFAFTRCFVDHETNELYIDYAIGGYGIEIDEYGPHLDQVSTSRRWKIYADCSLPGNISLLKRQGYNVEGCKKWAGSVEDGISHLKSYKQIIVHPRCKELIKEFSNYKWKRDRVTGEIQPIPIDKDNHYIDSLRYGLNKYIINAKTSLQQWSKLGK